MMMFEVLMYLFENYMDDPISLQFDQPAIMIELEQAGFNTHEIHKALLWLDGLNRIQESVQKTLQFTLPAMRYYTPLEEKYISTAGKGLLLYLEQLGILDPLTREIVIDRLVALDQPDLDLGKIKWVVLIALFSQPNKKSSLSLLQNMILSNIYDVLH